MDGMCADYFTKDDCFHLTQHILSVIGMLVSVTTWESVTLLKGTGLALKTSVLQVTVLIYSCMECLLGLSALLSEDRACGNDGTAMVAGARTCAACGIFHVWSDNSCLGHHHTGTTPCLYKLTPFISTTILLGVKVLLGLVQKPLCYCTVQFVILLLF